MKVSVVIPVYNVEKYLKQCLNSVIIQDFEKIICVEDCSTDSSYEILKEYEKKDNRIKIIKNEKNLGLGQTRNRGIDEILADYDNNRDEDLYIMHLDSDDWLEEDALKQIKKYIEPAKIQCIDIIQFNYFIFNSKTESKTPNKFQNFELYREKISCFEQNPQIISVWLRSTWAKLYRAKFLIESGIRFGNYVNMEDIEYSPRILLGAKSIYFLPCHIYNYRKYHPQSAMVNFIEKYHNDAIKAFGAVQDMCKNLDEEKKKKIMEKELQTYFYIVERCYIKGIFTYDKTLKLTKIADIDFLTQKDTQKADWRVFYHSITTDPKWLFEIRCRIWQKLKKLFCFAKNHYINKQNK